MRGFNIDHWEAKQDNKSFLDIQYILRLYTHSQLLDEIEQNIVICR